MKLLLTFAGVTFLAFGQQPQAQRPKPVMVGPMARMAAQPLFNNNCASCHKNVMTNAGGLLKEDNAPSTEVLSQMTTESIYAALTQGKMVQQAAKLSNEEKQIVAEFFGGSPLGARDQGDAKNMQNHCPANATARPANAGGASWNGWGNDLSNTRLQPAKAAGLTADQVGRLKLKWAFGMPGGSEAYGQPTIVDGRVYLADDNSFVYALDAKTGCVYWSFYTDGQTRASIVIGTIRTNGLTRTAAFIGDRKSNVYALDTRSGELLWKTNIDKRLLSHITGAPVLYDGRLYVGVAGSEEVASGDPHYPCCTYRGNLSALDANTGKVIWKVYTIPDEPKPRKVNAIGTQLWGPAGASIWSTPTIDPKQNAVYVATGNAFTEPAAKTSDAMIAYDLKTGKLLWSYQALADDASPQGCGGRGPKGEQCPEKVGPDYDFANSPILKTLPNGKRVLVAAHKGGIVVALDPDKKGALLWTADLTDGAVAGAGGQIMWGGAADDQNVYYTLQTGAVAAVRLADGKQAWLKHVDAAPGPRPRKGMAAAVTLIPGVLFAGGWDGVLHAFATEDGHELWSVPTAMEYKTVNGVSAKGGSIGAPGPVVVDGMVFVGSGYIGTGNGMPGNVVLAFGVE